jgi:hypothetical protein
MLKNITFVSEHSISCEYRFFNRRTKSYVTEAGGSATFKTRQAARTAFLELGSPGNEDLEIHDTNFNICYHTPLDGGPEVRSPIDPKYAMIDYSIVVCCSERGYVMDPLGENPREFETETDANSFIAKAGPDEAERLKVRFATSYVWKQKASRGTSGSQPQRVYWPPMAPRDGRPRKKARS